MMTGDQYICLDRALQPRTTPRALLSDALADGEALLPTIEDVVLAVMLQRPGLPAGAEPDPSPTTQFGLVQRTRYIKMGELRFFNGSVTYTARSTPDNKKRVDSDL